MSTRNDPILAGNILELVRFMRFDGVEDFADGAPERLSGPSGGVPKPVSDLGERLIGFRFGTVRRQEEHVCVGRADRPEDVRVLVTGEVVHHNHVTRAQRRDWLPRHPGQGDLAVDQAVEHPEGVDPVVKVELSGDEDGRVPVAEQGLSGQPLPLRPQPLGGTMFVFTQSRTGRQDVPGRSALMAHPAIPPTPHVGPVSLVGDARHLLETVPAALEEPSDRVHVNREAETRSRGAAGFASLHGRDDAHAKLHGVCLGH